VGWPLVVLVVLVVVVVVVVGSSMMEMIIGEQQQLPTIYSPSLGLKLPVFSIVCFIDHPLSTPLAPPQSPHDSSSSSSSYPPWCSSYQSIGNSHPWQLSSSPMDGKGTSQPMMKPGFSLGQRKKFAQNEFITVFKGIYLLFFNFH
jgi:hypothetical protein